jgi:hypothetical protein
MFCDTSDLSYTIRGLGDPIVGDVYLLSTLFSLYRVSIYAVPTDNFRYSKANSTHCMYNHVMERRGLGNPFLPASCVSRGIPNIVAI